MKTFPSVAAGDLDLSSVLGPVSGNVPVRDHA